MILCRNNERREAKVGDNIHIGFLNIVAKVIRIEPDGNDTWLVIVENGSETFVEPEDCTLIHRPFADDDPIEIVSKDTGEVIDKMVYRTHPDLQQMVGDYCYDIGAFMRHTDPALHDHEDYKREGHNNADPSR